MKIYGCFIMRDGDCCGDYEELVHVYNEELANDWLAKALIHHGVQSFIRELVVETERSVDLLYLHRWQYVKNEGYPNACMFYNTWTVFESDYRYSDKIDELEVSTNIYNSQFVISQISLSTHKAKWAVMQEVKKRNLEHLIEWR